MTAADLNGDGLKDLIVTDVTSNSVAVLLNTTAPGATLSSFVAPQSFATGAGTRDMRTADINGDGRVDLIVINYNTNSVTVLLNTTALGSTIASFATPQTSSAGSGPESMTAVDLNGDGRADLAITDYKSNSVSVLLNTTAPGATRASFATQPAFAVGSGPLAVTAADLNGDGRKDLVVADVNSNVVSVLLNTTAPGATTASFASQKTFATGAKPADVTAADLNGDGLKDLIVNSYSSNSISVLLNTTAPGASTPSFAAQQSFAAGSGPRWVIADDFNGDEKLDLAIADFGTGSVTVLANNTSPGSTTVSFAPPSTFSTGDNPQRITAADLNGDGAVDLILTDAYSATVSVLLNNTLLPQSTTIALPQTATFAVGLSPHDVKVADFNGDGKPDLVIVDTIGLVSVLLNTTAPGATSPSFAARQTFAAGIGIVVVADFNGDGLPDLVVNDLTLSSVSVLMNTTVPGATAVNFAAQQTFAVSSGATKVAAADLNGDGRPDLIVTDYPSSSVSVLLNTTAPGATLPSFAPPTTFVAGSGPLGVTAADLNGDGRADLIVTDYRSNSVSVLMNTTAPGAVVPSFAPQQTYATGVLPRELTAADVNGDGRQDLIVANYGSNTISVLLTMTPPGATTSSFAIQQTFAAGRRPASVTAVDFNGDGKPDILVSDYGMTGVSVLINSTTPGANTVSFADTMNSFAGGASYSIAAADVNDDGRPDVIVTNFEFGTASVLLNTLPPVAIAGSPATGTILDDDAPVTVTPVGGTTPQSATVNSPFGTNLAVVVKNAAGDPVANVAVTFTAPQSGPSGTFSGTGTSTVTVVTNASGIATAPVYTANGSAGLYAVSAVATGGSDPSNAFLFRNTDATPAPLFASPSKAIFAAGLLGTFTVTTTGTSAPTLSESNADALPSGVTFNAATGVLSGTPAANTQGDYVLHFTATNSVGFVQQTFTLKVTSQFAFAGEYAVFSGSGSPGLASVSQIGSVLTLNGGVVIDALLLNSTQFAINGVIAANYGNGSIVFASGPFAGQTWTKLDLPSNFTNPAGARVHVTQNGAAVTFVDRNGTQSPGTWLDFTRLSAYGETVTVGFGASAGQLLWSDGNVWSEVVSLAGTNNGVGVTSIAALPSKVLVTDYLTGSGKTVHTVQTGTTNIVFVDSVGSMVLGTYSNPNTNVPQATAPNYPGYTASIVGNTITWTDGKPADTVVWTETAIPASTIIVTDYTNQNGVPVHVVQNGANVFVIVDGTGNTSLGHFLTATTGVADSYPTDMATFSGNVQSGTSKLVWSDGVYVWTQTASPPLLITAIDQNGKSSHLAFRSVTILVGLDGPLQGVAGTWVNDEIEWSNGAVWANLGFDALTALFETGTGFP